MLLTPPPSPLGGAGITVCATTPCETIFKSQEKPGEMVQNLHILAQQARNLH